MSKAEEPECWFPLSNKEQQIYNFPDRSGQQAAQLALAFKKPDHSMSPDARREETHSFLPWPNKHPTCFPDKSKRRNCAADITRNFSLDEKNPCFYDTKKAKPQGTRKYAHLFWMTFLCTPSSPHPSWDLISGSCLGISPVDLQMLGEWSGDTRPKRSCFTQSKVRA